MKYFKEIIKISLLITLTFGLILLGIGLLISYLAGNGHIILALLVAGIFLFLCFIAHIGRNYEEIFNKKNVTKIN